MALICPKCRRRNSGAPSRCSCGTAVRVSHSNSRSIRDDDDCDTLIDVMIIGSMTGVFDDSQSYSSSSSSFSSYESSTSSYDSSSSYSSGSSSSDSGGSCD